jgi:hypothetical protein
MCIGRQRGVGAQIRASQTKGPYLSFGSLYSLPSGVKLLCDIYGVLRGNVAGWKGGRRQPIDWLSKLRRGGDDSSFMPSAGIPCPSIRVTTLLHVLSALILRSSSDLRISFHRSLKSGSEQ